MDIVMMDIESVIPYENNPRNNDSAVESVANSIREFGFKQPIVVDRDNIVIVGHTRLKAARKLGIEQVPVLVADDLSEDEVRAYRLADNKVSELAEWDFGKLERELDSIDMDMTWFGFDYGEEFSPSFDDGDEVDEYDDGEIICQITFENSSVFDSVRDDIVEIVDRLGTKARIAIKND